MTAVAKRARLCGAAAIALSAIAGCSGGGGGTDDGIVRSVSIGGILVYCSDDDVHIANGTVAFTDEDGGTRTAVSGSNGLFTLDDVREGAYEVLVSASGYEPVVEPFVVNQPGSSPSEYVDFGVVCLEEKHETAVVQPWGVTVRDGETLNVDADGNPFVYDFTDHGDVTVTLTRPAAPGFGFPQYPYVNNLQTFVYAQSAPDAASTVFTITESQITGLALSTNGVLHRVGAPGLVQYDPINGGQQQFSFTLRFYAQP